MNPINPSLAAFQGLGPGLSALGFAPFAVLLGVIAVFPLVPSTESWWGSNRNKALVALLCALAGVGYFLANRGGAPRLEETLLDYLTFMALLASLYVVCGGIHISGAFAGLPTTNTLFLALGALLANFMGTTGASMILIRPLLRANRRREHTAHIVIFFIFIVSNGGGLLTPLGDPPLYLGFLRGVPFAWTFRLFPHWLLLTAALLAVFYFIDEVLLKREGTHLRHSLLEEVRQAERKLHVEGWRNLSFLAAILGVILAAGYWVYPAFARLYGDGVGRTCSEVFQILSMSFIALMSYDLTAPRMYRPGLPPPSSYAKNEFSMAAILEVGILFFGIFGAMMPALAILDAKGPSLPVSHAWQYFWGSGFLSSFLDNTPTYLTFSTLAAGKAGLAGESLAALAGHFPRLLEAVACGSVFMGANTYIGNGPNFMVKTIAEHSKVKMPSFFRYMLWSGCVLLPLFLLETLIFFR